MTKVTLRKKLIKEGEKESLYLDFYPPIQTKGKLSRRKFLNLYLHKKPKTQIEKDYNKDTLLLAQSIAARTQLEVQRGEYGFEKKEEIELIACFRNYVLSKNKSVKRNGLQMMYRLQEYAGYELYEKNLTIKVMEGFKDHLLKKSDLAQMTAWLYFNVFKACIKKAFRDGIIEKDYSALVQSVRQSKNRKEYLTNQELNLLVKTNCERPVIKAAFLFSCLTGLRFSDIAKLTLANFKIENGTPVLSYTQQKTKLQTKIPISIQAYNLLGWNGKHADDDSKIFVFAGMYINQELTESMRKWMKAAGIQKKITFHCARHTYATLQLAAGTDIVTVSKMLGHSSIATTMIYVKEVEMLKSKTVDKIILDIPTYDS
ncbi:MAG: tyrosine-type recombinase/integrase [Leadbetterella sp.]